MIVITVKPAESGAAKVTVGPFRDEDGNLVTPTSITWSLSTLTGTIVNSRHNVSVTPGSTVAWLISDADLAVSDGDTARMITVTSLYTSTLGSNIPLREQARFNIETFAVNS